MARHAVVVGGGIGGLASAVALQRRGWQVTALEKQSSISEIGAGITLWPNALRALDALGIGARIRSLGLAQISGGLRSSTGKWLSRTDTEEMTRRFGDGMVVVERRELLSVLAAALTDVEIRTSAEVSGVDADGTVTIDAAQGGDDERIRGDITVGADGLRSVVRGSLWPDAEVRPIGMVAWRLIGRVADPRIVQGGETWGRGEYAGLTPLPDGRIYAWFVTPVSADAPPEPDEAVAWLQNRFAAWHYPFPQLLERIAPEQLLRHELFDLAPLRTLVSGRVALVGDAAHAMTPNLGQGACQALEDAVELAAAVGDGTAPAGDVVEQLHAYDGRRRPRVQSIAKRSRTAGTVAALRGRTRTAIRNVLVNATPSNVSLRTIEPVVGWNPPQI